MRIALRNWRISTRLVALLTLTSRRSLMQDQVNSRLTTVCMTAVVILISGLNVLLLGQQIG